VRRRLRAREIGVRKMKIRTRESGSKWDLDGKLGGSGAIQANRTEFDRQQLGCFEALELGRYFTLFGFSASVTIELRYVTYHVLLSFSDN